MWERAPSYATLGGGGAGASSSRVLNVTAVLRINQQPVLYTPPLSEVLQSGWSKVRVKLFHIGIVQVHIGKDGRQMCTLRYASRVLERTRKLSRKGSVFVGGLFNVRRDARGWCLVAFLGVSG